MMMKDKRVIWLILSMLVCGWACSDKTIIYNPEQKRSIYFYKDVNRYASGVVPDTIEFSFAALEESEYPVLSEQACRKAVSSYSESYIAKRYIEVYNKITGRYA